MNRSGPCSLGVVGAGLVAVILLVLPARAASADGRISRIEKELAWVQGELRELRIYQDAERRERLREEIAQLEEEMSKLRRTMPESVNRDELQSEISRGAEIANVDVHTDEGILTDHGDYQSLTVRVMAEGAVEAIDRFIARLQRSPGAKHVTKIEETHEGPSLVEVAAFMIPSRPVEPRSCSIPPLSPEAGEREVRLRDRLVSDCATLDAADADLRRELARWEQLTHWIALTSDLVLNAPRLEPADEALAAAEAEFEADLMAEIEALLEEPERAPVDERQRRADAMDDIRRVATAAEAYSVDHDHYPETSDMARLAITLESYAAGSLALTDPWGMPYRWISDGREYRIISGGEDRAIEEASLALASDTYGEDDIVYQNGSFLTAP